MNSAAVTKPEQNNLTRLQYRGHILTGRTSVCAVFSFAQIEVEILKTCKPIRRAVVAGCTILAAARGATPWLPEPGKAIVSIQFVNGSFRDFIYGSNSAALTDPYKQNTLFTSVEYGLKRDLALDVETGYTKASAGRIGIPPLTDLVPRQGASGIADTTIGLRWQVARTESGRASFLRETKLLALWAR